MVTAAKIKSRLKKSFRAKPCRACEFADMVTIDLLSVGLEAVDPSHAVRRFISRDGSRIYLDEERSRYYDVSGGFYIIAFGKAAAGMVKPFLSSSSKYLRGGYVILPKTRFSRRDAEYLGKHGIEVFFGGFPLPNQESLNATKKILDFIMSLDDDARLVILISGGGSSLFEIPLEGISLDDLIKAYSLLMIKGLNVKDRATIKKHLSSIKGGRLTRYIYPRRTVSLILSSVFDDDLSSVASGPTVPDPTTYEDAKEILTYHGLWGSMPVSIQRVIMMGIEGDIPETPKEGEPIFEGIENVIIGSGRIGLKFMKAYAEARGYNAFFLTSRLEGEAREVGKVVGGLVDELYINYNPVEPPAVLLIGGETTVTVTGDGVGGRNQELLMPIIKKIRGMHGVSVIAFNTDGIDGISPAGGAVIDGCTYDEMLRKGLSIEESLNNNDSFTFFDYLGRALITGDTGTDVNDYIIVFISI